MKSIHLLMVFLVLIVCISLFANKEQFYSNNDVMTDQGLDDLIKYHVKMYMDNFPFSLAQDQNQSTTIANLIELSKIQSGNVYANLNCQGGPQSRSFPITFKAPFSQPPSVFAAFSHMDWCNNGVNLRADIAVQNITTTGCSIVVQTWADTSMYALGVNWIAIPSNALITSSQLKNMMGNNEMYPVLVSGRYVKISATQVQCMNVAEIQVFSSDSTQNIAQGKNVSMSSGYNGNMFPGQNLVDGNLSNFAHTSCADVPWMIIDLGAVVPVSKIVVFSRADCCSGRMAGSSVSVLDGAKNVVWKSDTLTNTNGLTTDQEDASGYPTYTMFPPSTTVTGR